MKTRKRRKDPTAAAVEVKAAAAAAAAALVTQLATALVCSAQPCRGKLSSHARTLSSLHYGSTAVVKVTSSLDWGEKILTFKIHLFKRWTRDEACMCSQYTARAYTGWSSEKECFSFYCKKRSFPVSLLSNIDRIKMKDRNESTIAGKFIFQRCFLKIKIESKVSSREQRLRQRTILSH